MEQPHQYCENCSKPLRATARFCGRCGQPVETPEPERPSPQGAQARAPEASVSPPPPQPDWSAIPSPAQPTPMAQAEAVMGVIPNARRIKGFLGSRSQTYHLVVTNLRLLFALQTNAMIRESARRAQEAAKQQGEGWLGQVGSMMGAHAGGHYLQMFPKNILAEHPENFFVMNNHIHKVTLLQQINPNYGNRDAYEIHVHSTTSKIRLAFQHLNGKKTGDLLSRVLGNIVDFRSG